MTRFVAFTNDAVERITDCVGSALLLLEKHPEERERAMGYLGTAMEFLSETGADSLIAKLEAEQNPRG
jgi:hypothetical protein